MHRLRTNDAGEVTRVYAEYDTASRGGNAADGRRVRGTIHWVDARTAQDAEINLYENLFTVEDPDNAEGGYESVLREDSRVTLKNCKLEAGLADAPASKGYQFLRQGYFCKDNHSEGPVPVFNRTVSLKDSYKVPKQS